MVTQPAFDDRGAPSRELIDDCVHCGFCLPTCPTYLLWGEEMDSPRGRIHLMHQGLEGAPLEPMVRHFDQCLGCMACVTACPSGVQYDRLIEATRAQVERRYDRPRRERLLREAIFKLFPYPERLRKLARSAGAYQRSGLGRLVRRSGLLDRLPPTMGAMEGLLPDLGPAQPVAERTSAAGEQRARVGMLLGCVQREFFPGVNAATVECSLPRAARCSRRPRRGAAERCPCTAGARRRPRRSHGGSSGRSKPLTSTTSWSTSPGAAPP